MPNGLFDNQQENTYRKNGPDTPPAGDAPLAERMRPQSLDGFIGQEHILAPGKPVRRLLEEDRFGSLLLWGPPGTGKTTLAQLASRITGRLFSRLSAVESGVKELKEVIKKARYDHDNGKRTVLFIDEIHRYSKTQQDALLPHVESGLVTFIGATTENPSFGVIPALRSRCMVLELRPLAQGQIEALIRNALDDSGHGLGGQALEAPDEVIEQIALQSGGDARVALTLLEGCANAATDGRITRQLVEEYSQKAFLLYDKAGQGHYDHASAFQKSMRGSDPDAALYWMARMLDAGEDPRFIARRLMVTAAEDVGNADPTALILAVSAAEAVEKLGLPEGRIPLAQAVLYVASAPKSNSSVTAVDAALDYVKQQGSHPQVPFHLRTPAYQGNAVKDGGEKDYKYPHSYPGHWVEQRYLPEGMDGISFYKPSPHGREATFAEQLRKLKKK